MRINNNMMAMNAYRQLGLTNTAGSKSMEKLSSGYRINRAGDDAAGLAISEKMRGQIRGLNMASKNAQDGISLIQTAEGALNESHAILQRMRELAVQAANDTNVEVDREALQAEIDQLASELTRIGNTTQFNKQDLLKGDFDKKFQIGANTDQNIQLSISDMRAASLDVGKDVTAVVSGSGSGATYYLKNDSGNVAQFFEEGDVIIAASGSGSGATPAVTADVAGYYVLDSGGTATDELYLAAGEAFEADTKVTKGITISSQSGANDAITTINDAIETVSKERSKLGAVQNRLEHTIKNLDTSSENLQSAESRIRDVDYAEAA